jgi:hypothetical protein
MAHLLTTWAEAGMTAQAKVVALTNLESIYADAIDYMTNMVHDIYTQTQADSRYYKTPNHPGYVPEGAGSGIDATYLGGASLAKVLAGSLPSGVIGMFGLGTIPAILQECDGSNGSPDLRDFFIRGAGNGINPGSTGGSNNITITAPTFSTSGHILASNEMAQHNHTFDDVYNGFGSSTGGPNGPNNSSRTDNTISTNGLTGGTADPHSHADGTFTWTGYKDADGVIHNGAYDNRPEFIAVKFVMVR